MLSAELLCCAGHASSAFALQLSDVVIGHRHPFTDLAELPRVCLTWYYVILIFMMLANAMEMWMPSQNCPCAQFFALQLVTYCKLAHTQAPAGLKCKEGC